MPAPVEIIAAEVDRLVSVMLDPRFVLIRGRKPQVVAEFSVALARKLGLPTDIPRPIKQAEVLEVKSCER